MSSINYQPPQWTAINSPAVKPSTARKLILPVHNPAPEIPSHQLSQKCNHSSTYETSLQPTQHLTPRYLALPSQPLENGHDETLEHALNQLLAQHIGHEDSKCSQHEQGQESGPESDLEYDEEWDLHFDMQSEDKAALHYPTPTVPGPHAINTAGTIQARVEEQPGQEPTPEGNKTEFYEQLANEFLAKLVNQPIPDELGTSAPSLAPNPETARLICENETFIRAFNQARLGSIRAVRGPLPTNYIHIDVASEGYIPAPRFQYHMFMNREVPMDDIFRDLALLYLIYPEHGALFTLMNNTFRNLGRYEKRVLTSMNALPHLKYLVGLCRKCFVIGEEGELCCGAMIPF